MYFYFLFPFDKVAKDSKIVLYGGGGVARYYIDQINSLNWCTVPFIVDKNYNTIKPLRGIEVYHPDKLKVAQYDCIVISVDHAKHQSVLRDLELMGINPNEIVYSDSVLVYHNNFTFGAYSQHGEDMVITNIFNTLGIEKPSYIDVGACHPYFSSNTALLYARGSRGINIEANPDLMELFLRERPNDCNVNIGVGVEKGELPFYVIDTGGSVPTGSFNYESAAQFVKVYADKNFRIAGEKSLPITTLDEIVAQYCGGVFPDFMDIDIESLDYDVLKNCDFSSGKPLVICAELSDKRMNDMLEKKGFVPYCKMYCNMIYVRKELLPRLLDSTI